jgi:hypothetical protein
MISGSAGPRWNLNPGLPRRKEEEGKRTWRDFELRGQLNRFAILDYPTSSRVVGEALEVEDEYRWKRFNEYRDLPARFAGARAGWTDLWPRDVRECILNGMY